MMVSVILAVYNGIGLVEQAITSVIEQSYNDWELLILDDCSTDNSWEYLQSLNHSKIIIFKNDVNKGLFYNLNFLIAKSQGNIIKLWESR